MSNKGGGFFIVVLSLLLIITAVGVGGGFFYWQSAKKSSEALYVQPNPQIGVTPAEEKNTPDETVNWKVFVDTERGFQLRYPQDWLATTELLAHPIGNEPVLVADFLPPGQKYKLVLSVRAKGSENALTTRTGVGAGEFFPGESVVIEGQKINYSKLVFQDKVKEIYYSNKLGPGIAIIGNKEIVAEFTIVPYAGSENIDLAKAPELQTANQILSTLSFLNQ